MSLFVLKDGFTSWIDTGWGKGYLDAIRKNGYTILQAIIHEP